MMGSEERDESDILEAIVDVMERRGPVRRGRATTCK